MFQHLFQDLLNEGYYEISSASHNKDKLMVLIKHHITAILFNRNEEPQHDHIFRG